jgi:hypothetical protein
MPPTRCASRRAISAGGPCYGSKWPAAMSRHGMIPRASRFPPPRPEPDGSSATLRLALNVFLRETVIGVLLWAVAVADTGTRLAVMLACLCALVPLTRRFGILRPRGWMRALQEAVLLYFGAICVCNLLLLGFGRAPWCN